MKKPGSVQDEQRDMGCWNEEQKEANLKHLCDANTHL